jgi:CPA2 family monovalent cation:H+ antiporter-2
MPELTAPSIVEIGGLLLAAAAAGWLARRAGLPAVVGYLAVGLVVSPFTPGFVADRAQLQLLADVGVILLLFEVGIEVDLPRLGREQRQLLWIAPLQTVLTSLIVGIVGLAVGLPPLGAAAVGVAIAISSSVVIVNMTRSRRRTTDPETEHALIGWAVLQDVTGVLLAAVVVALMAPEARPFPLALLALAVFLVIAIAAAWFIARILRRLREEHDLFLIVSVASGLTLAGVGGFVFGLPMGLAAFVAGLAITESPDAAEARRRLLPFRDVFAVLFFVALGTLIDPNVLSIAPGWLVLLLALVLVAKVGVSYGLARAFALRARPGQLAIGLGQIGEFSFVLATAAMAAGVLSNEVYVALLGTAALTIATSSVGVRLFWPPTPRPAVVGGASP